MSEATDWRTKKDIPTGYYLMDTLTFKKVPNLNDYYYTVTLTTQGREFLLTLRPDDNYSDMITTAEKRRQYETERKRKEELRRLKQKQEEAETERLYMAELQMKYGSSNAKLIINGEVRLGFSETMCEEAWGTPYDITRVTTQLGTTEAWWYGDGNVLYFQNGKLVMIQN